MTVMFTPTEGWITHHPSPSKPRFIPPIGAVDAHCHVFGPGSEFPYAPERKYTPVDAGRDQLFALRDYLGFSRNVIVQATCHGADNSAMLDACLGSHGQARGVATIRPDFSDDQLAEMDAAGVRGIRFNFVKRLVDPKPDAYYRSLIERIQPLGWHVVIYFEPADLEERWDLFTSMPTTVVVDHMGRPDVTAGINGPGFARFLHFMQDNPNVWSKVSCPERLSIVGPPSYADVLPYSREVVTRFPDRVLWGTDWPHPNMTTHAPDDGNLVDLIPLIAPTAELQNALLVDNPSRLYWGEDGSR